MTPARETSSAIGSSGSLSVSHLLLTEGDVKRMAVNPEQVMEEIQMRATLVSSVLNGILLEPHGRIDWGLNE